MEDKIKENVIVLVKDIDKIQDICSALVSHVAGGKPGISQENLDWLRTTRNNYRTLRSFYYKKRTGESIPKKKYMNLKEKGLTTDKISEDETFVASELLDALHFTFDYIDKTEPKAAGEREGKKSIEYVTVATKANIEFADFFLKVHQRFNLKDEDLYGLFDFLFEKAGITRELEARGLDRFPGGILAAVRAYLHLSSQLPDWKLRVPEVELDRDHSIDLIAESKRGGKVFETRYFEIKGRRNTKKVEVTEITEESRMEKLREDIILNTSNDRDRNVKLISLYKIFDFTKSQIKKGRNTKAYWVEVPSTV